MTRLVSSQNLEILDFKKAGQPLICAIASQVAKKLDIVVIWVTHLELSPKAPKYSGPAIEDH